MSIKTLKSWIVRVDELDEKCSIEPSTLIIIVNFKGIVGCGGSGQALIRPRRELRESSRVGPRRGRNQEYLAARSPLSLGQLQTPRKNTKK